MAKSETAGDWKREKKIQHPDGNIVDGHGSYVKRAKTSDAGKGDVIPGTNFRAYQESSLWDNMGPGAKNKK